MTPEQKEVYLSRCQEIAQMTRYGYTNPELEKLMLSPDWKILYKPCLTVGERKQAQSYLEFIKDTSFGCLDTQIKGWESLVEKIRQIRKKALRMKR